MREFLFCGHSFRWQCRSVLHSKLVLLHTDPLEPEWEITLRVEENLSSFLPDTNQQKVFTKIARLSIRADYSLIRNEKEQDLTIPNKGR